MERYYRSIISGEAAGAVPALLRTCCGVLSVLYSALIRLRNFAYDHHLLPTTRLDVPVISVGNLTTGGTGKTPTVIQICKELQAQGRKPCVLTRGYKAPPGQLPDEVQVIQHECPGVPIVVNPDRIAGGRQAIAEHHPDVLILDDGFQHRRLARDLDIVLLDATAPLGIPGVLPRGTWREPPAALRRAGMLVLTRCEQVTPELADLAAEMLTEWISPRHIFQQHTRVVGIYDAAGRPVTPLGQKVAAFAGIGNTAGFLHTLRTLGLNVSAACWFDDHHVYHPAADFAGLERLTRERPIAAWVTTLKDWVKLKGAPAPAPLWHVRIDAVIPGSAAQAFRQRLSETVIERGKPNPRPTAAAS